ncbi:precorrin-6A/cobalt-precorrin-6A reductase [Polaribacter sp. Q13]|uniref:precorrin-6A/cobalt-precorrin-6A reductase n=1 Tax=Polaribacter sp. Q13 TaxID=2806551 RepID=UPI00193B5207|nr:precorrin-6A/cobalt-precorrin-6A reductase [Polaribacter sp. Q13]QVY65953.1 precorrin-6A/cobalt-precorrin-6A reductase [Polaribacter sp. Q13]
MILVFGGTTEGKKAATLLEGLAMPFVYSTKTNIPFKTTKIASYRYGALDEKQLESYLLENNIQTIINASHPFAEILHKTIAKVAEKLQIPVLRFGRELLSKTIHPLVKYVNSYEAAFALLKEKQTLLALTGVQSIKKLHPWWLENTTYFRILNRPESLAIAHESNFPEKQLILGLPSDNLEKEIELIKSHQIDVILTKETGNSGFLSTKIEAALQTNAKIIIINQPKIPSYFTLVFNEIDLQRILTNTPTPTLLTNTSQLWD